MAGDRGEYEAWRATRHEAMPTTDRSLLDDVVHDATGQRAIEWSRIVLGEVNEVYAATLPSGADVIVRVSRDGRRRFHSERWAMDAARTAGVPVPDVLSIAEREDEAGTFLVCVESRIPGRPLGDVDDPNERERMAVFAGEVTARLHTVAIKGFGSVRIGGTGPARSWAQVMRPWQNEDQAAATREHAVAAGVPVAWLGAAADELQRHESLFESVESRLLHGDLSSAHVMTDGVSVTALIDFEQAFAGDPTFEFVRWDYFRADSPLEWLLKGYQRVADLGSDVELRIKLGRLRLHLALIDFYAGSNHPVHSELVHRRFAEDAEWFGFATA